VPDSQHLNRVVDNPEVDVVTNALDQVTADIRTTRVTVRDADAQILRKSEKRGFHFLFESVWCLVTIATPPSASGE
jgi:hypothetical protein